MTVENTAKALIRWIRETGADKLGYVGPSSRKALKRILNGEDPKKTGISGTTCGAAMRAMAPSLSVKKGNSEALEKAVLSCSLPTHNTNIALEAAMALGFAIHSTASGESFEGIIDASIEGASIGRELADARLAGASSGERIRYFLKEMKILKSKEEALSFIYSVVGTSMESNEVVPASIAVFAYARKDVWLSVKMGASCGGDTDTIAAIAGLLSSLYAGEQNIPPEIVSEVVKVNALDLRKYAVMISEMFGQGD